MVFSSTDYGRHVLGKVSISVPVFWKKMNVKSPSTSFHVHCPPLFHQAWVFQKHWKSHQRQWIIIYIKMRLWRAKRKLSRECPSDPACQMRLFPIMVVADVKDWREYR